jgi:hypothetical protein
MSLVYFEDASKAANPVCLKGKKWNGIKSRIEKEVRSYFRK